ncbi:facilitated trehalose transporter Tret1-2 homolog isoform X2 [Bicyclus anynana]|uniref:Facilitated trehalose transporter Tret1-2 homolog isoform X2 n=1 Tax=Bicyclus anynana TaxID=110368 RepID=A0ABM3LMK3_BICAN|nr:facilitated trehalose transporter Tret1-2 homolog isoform X2 [Bicyclus anynana]
MERGRLVQYLVAVALSLSTATIGTLSAWPTPVVPKIKNNETFVDITKDELATVMAMSPLGFVVGSLATRFISDSLGRRTTILASVVPIICGTIIATLARVSWLLCIMYFLWGIGTGMISTVVGIYTAEIADKDIRATLSVGTRFMFNFGNLLVISIGPFLSYYTLNYCFFILPVVYFVACVFIPESPYYYLKEGRVEHARKSLLKLKDKEIVDQELELMKGHVSKEMRNSSSAWELFTGKQYRRPLVIAFGVLSSFVVDRVGRRPLLIYSFLSTGICLAIAGLYFFLQEVIRVDHSVLKAYGIAAFMAIMLSNGLSIGYSSIIGVITAEIFPLNVKFIAMTSVNILGGCLGSAVAKSYQAINNVAGFCGVFWVFASVAFVGAIFSYMTTPETKGKSLQEIQEMLHINIVSSDEEGKLNDVEVIEMIEKCRELKESKKDYSL